MSIIEEAPVNDNPALNTDATHDSTSAMKPDDKRTATAGPYPEPADNLTTADAADHARSATSGLPEAHPTLSQAPSVNPSEAQPVTPAEDTPTLPPRPEPVEHTMAITTAVPENPVAPGIDAAPQEERVSPQVESLRAMFPDFDTAVL